LFFTAVLHDLRREPQAAREKIESLLTICQDRGFALYTDWGTILHGRTLVELNETEEGITQIQQGLSAWQDMGARLLLPNYLFYLAEAQGKAGRVEEGLRSLDEAFGIEEETGERAFEAELYQLKGELLLAQGDGAADAEAYFQRALQVARSQSARSWELRAALSLARLWKKQGKTIQAGELLDGVYGWFTEGFDTPDLQEARSLLGELGDGS
jgi:predicted ATPase